MKTFPLRWVIALSVASFFFFVPSGHTETPAPDSPQTSKTEDVYYDTDSKPISRIQYLGLLQQYSRLSKDEYQSKKEALMRANQVKGNSKVADTPKPDPSKEISSFQKPLVSTESSSK